jgi:4,5-DOPA dioxygenase extradiol
MAERMPVVFISHGAPDALLQAQDAVAKWREIGSLIPQPKAILAISAHWEASLPTASLSTAPTTIHDFSGFAAELYRMNYPAPGAPELAEHAVSLLTSHGIRAELHPDRGLDHGAWVPLKAMYPEANVPVTQLSLIQNGSPAEHLTMGSALAPLRDEGVLILATGAITHNFGWLVWQPATGLPDEVPQARSFADWVASRLAAKDTQALMAYRTASLGAEAHPREEHFLPLFVALGAAGSEVPVRFQPHFAYGGLAMDAYVWQPPSSAPV